ncbi:MAG: metallophosphoesterase [Polyangiales bacterium]
MKLAVWWLVLAACTRPGDDRPLVEETVGSASIADATVSVGDGLAAVRELSDHRIDLWATAPAITIDITLGSTGAGAWTLIVRNSLHDSALTVDGAPIARDPGTRPTVAQFQLALGAGPHALVLAPPDADRLERYRVAAMADIQQALPTVNEVFAAINAVPDARFVIAMGDITDRGEIAEYDLFEQQLGTLDIPFYSTIGNHELWQAFDRYTDRYGRADFQFGFKGAAFTFADTGDAGLDPIVEDWLVDRLAAAKDSTSVFLTHIPPLDPVGARYGAFRSSRDGHRLVSRLVGAGVDLALYGHIHTYVGYANAGIPSYISGGGGAEPMKGDGIDRHFLMVELDPENQTIGTVEVHRVD